MSQPKHIDLFVGRRLRERRIAMGLTQGSLAEAIQISPAQVDAIEKGEVRIEANKLIQASEILQVRLGYFFDGA